MLIVPFICILWGLFAGMVSDTPCEAMVIAGIGSFLICLMAGVSGVF
ncbi:hypothetical protein PMW_202 [Pseudomonas phage phiPMW]|uniref:Uncharacterized protein n=1 Tax=Pseudomonas phage phiPMW TaxID=1815582 RepID=A0A1S5R1P0_9CAUD|nr:hypothetical protein FDG97_gp148 [Pseudomonas phage phiPMW]ANA49327.1 hypothetical protein PMW_202 [Pseudomonas phage phiPMW]